MALFDGLDELADLFDRLAQWLATQTSEYLRANLGIGDRLIQDHRRRVGEPEPGGVDRRRALQPLGFQPGLRARLDVVEHRQEVVEHLVACGLLCDRRERRQRREPPELAQVLKV